MRPGYKQTEVGVIPEDWEVQPLGALTEPKRPISYGIVQTGQNIPNGVKCLRVVDIEDGRINKADLITTTKAISDAYRRTILRAGDLVTPLRGKVGDVALVDEDLAGSNLTRGVAVIAIRPDLNALFFKQFISSVTTRGRLEQSMNGSALQEVPIATLRAFKVVFPSTKAEQEAIAEALSDTDGLIESLEQLLAKKRNLKQGVMQELLTGKKRLPGFSGEWVVKRLGDVIEKFIGGGTPSRSNPQYWDDEIPWVTVKDFATFNPRYSQEAITKVGLQNSASHLIPKGTLITSTRMALGKAVVYEVDVAINQDLKALFPKPVLATQYLYFWFQYYGQSIDELGSGSTVKGISLPDLKKIEFRLPSRPEQTAIAAILSDMDAEIAALEAKLNKARQIKQGMMHNLLTGKIRLVTSAAAKGEQQVPVSGDTAARKTAGKPHNWAINEAVVISMLADRFGQPEFPLGRKRYTKLSYLLHRKAEREAQGYLKKAAGPYNPKTKYAGPEKIAQENGYVRYHDTGRYKGFIAAENIEQAKAYFAKWYGGEIAAWLEQFRRSSNDDLERLATVDMAMQELHRQGKTVDVAGIRALIASEPEWLPKLERTVFSEAGIAAAITECHALFGS